MNPTDIFDSFTFSFTDYLLVVNHSIEVLTFIEFILIFCNDFFIEWVDLFKTLTIDYFLFKVVKEYLVMINCSDNGSSIISEIIRIKLNKHIPLFIKVAIIGCLHCVDIRSLHHFPHNCSCCRFLLNINIEFRQLITKIWRMEI